MGFRLEMIRSIDMGLSCLPMQKTASALDLLSQNDIRLTLNDVPMPENIGRLGVGLVVRDADLGYLGTDLTVKDVARTIKRFGSADGIQQLNFLNIRTLDLAKLIWWRDRLYKAFHQLLLRDQLKAEDYNKVLDSFFLIANAAVTQEQRGLVKKMLFEMVYMHDTGTAVHQDAVRKLSVATARRMGLPELEIANIELAAYLHDIGKIGMSRKLLNKRSTVLTEDDIERIHLHVDIGVEILGRIKWMPKEVIEMVRYHHYLKGYPKGIDREKAPIGAKIMAVADSYDAMRNRTYTRQKNKEEAIQDLKSVSGYDKRSLEAFIQVAQLFK